MKENGISLFFKLMKKKLNSKSITIIPQNCVYWFIQYLKKRIVLTALIIPIYLNINDPLHTLIVREIINKMERFFLQICFEELVGSSEVEKSKIGT